MGCIYEDWEGNCQMFEDGHRNGPMGCDKEGKCNASGDPDPNVSCDTYESDSVCPDCEADLNIEDCTCDD